MKVKNGKIGKLLEKYKDIYLLNRINALLQWDLNVNLPEKGGEGRAMQSAYLTKLITDKWLETDFRNLLESALVNNTSYTTGERAIIRNLNYSSEYFYKVPKEIIVEFAETTSNAFMSWQYAKKDDKFSDFLPHLKKVIELCKVIAGHLGFSDNPYDALLNLYEPGLTAEDCRKVFGELQPALTAIIKKITTSKNYISDSGLINGRNRYPADDQKQLATFVLRKMNYDLSAGRMDVSPHPFTDTLGRFDVRITTGYDELDFRGSFTAAMHEAGHALYEQGVREEYDSTPLDGGVSMGIHESQSRFWENQIGRSFEFQKFMEPIFHAFYPEQLSKSGAEDFFRLFNLVKPSFIRVEADEVTYNLHLALRFELEEGLINGKIKAGDLPDVWREKMKKYLGVVPETDREGVLQDIHWSNGMFGYFPTYTLGNLYAAQFAAKMKKDFPDQAGSEVGNFVEKGELGPVLSWLRTNIHQYGSLYWPKELCRQVTGEDLNPKYFLGYIKDKYSKIYKF